MNSVYGPLLWLCLLLGASGTAAEVDPDALANRQRCLAVLRQGLHSGEFWPSIHAAEALTQAGQTAEVRQFLEPLLAAETDDQRRCGIARELVRAGDLSRSHVMLDILSGSEPHGHVHAAESLYKVGWQGDAAPLRQAMRESEDVRLQIMAAAALAKHGPASEQADAFAVLRTVLRDADEPAIFRLSAWVLGRIGEDGDRELIRSRLADADADVQVRAFLEHALAALGDPAGRQALLKNLDSGDPAIRTYAAVFAGECQLTQANAALLRQLDDQDVDARIRAAQAWLLLNQ